MMPKPPHRLSLYRATVQHPQAEVRFLLRAYDHYASKPPHGGSRVRGCPGGRLREDFAGTAAVAAAWVEADENHRALAVEQHGPTVRWAQRTHEHELGERVEDLHIVQADVLDLTAPRVDMMAALNFSTFIYHDRTSLRRYFRHARRCLRPGGLLVIDAFGGPGAMRPGVQRRQVTLEAPLNRPARPQGAEVTFTYEWEQRAYDAVTGRIDCRIHFEWPGPPAKRIANAFIYRWRLWTLPELRELMREAGFAAAEVWCDRMTAEGQSDGHYRPTTALPAREDWVAYIVGVR